MQKKMFLGSAVLAAASAFVAGCDKPEVATAEQQAEVTLEQPAVPAGVQSDIVALPPPPKDTDVIASVGASQMTWAELNQQVDQMVVLAAAQYGQPIPSEELPQVKQQFRRMAVQTFVVENVICQAAANAGIVIDEAYRATEIAAIEKETGKKMDELFAGHPAGAERAKDMFEKGLIEKRLLDELVFSKVAVSDEEIAATIEKNAAELAVLNEKMADFAQQCAADPAAFDALVEANSVLKTPVARPDEDLKPLFGDVWPVVAALAEGEISPALHIQGLKVMVKCNKLPAGGDDALLAKAEELRQRVLAGEDFAALAQEFSKCPSGQRGGDLGPFSKGQMVPEFEQAVLTQEIGKVGAPVKTQFGYHLIVVTERGEEGSVVSTSGKNGDSGSMRASHILLMPETRELTLLALPTPPEMDAETIREEMTEQRKRQAAMEFYETQRQTLGVTSTLFPEFSAAPVK